jgi:hypothetical protein
MSTEPTSERDVVSGPAPPSALRGAVVTFGPSLVLAGLAVAGTLATLRRLLSLGTSGHGISGLDALGAAAPWLYLLGLRRWVLSWGARPDELTRDLPGDDLVPQVAWTSTRAISIAAPVEAVWPWLAQMGQDKGGLYSYDWLENLAGLEIHSADRINPEWQAVGPGDVVRFAPGQDTLTVALAERNQALVWEFRDPITHEGPAPTPAAWAFVLVPDGPSRTRLIQRLRLGGRPRWLVGLIYTTFVEIPHFIMERRMLLGIRDRAQRAWAAERAADTRSGGGP